MKTNSLITLLYGIIILFFGIYWSIVNDNTLSLIFGFSIGMILFINAFSIFFKNNITGVYATLLLSLALTVVFAVRLSSSVSLMPGGVMFLSSMITMGSSIYALALMKTKDAEE